MKDWYRPKQSAGRWTGKPIKLRIAGSLRGEVERFDIEIQMPGEPVYTTDFEIDHDMFGGGFVGGLDVDGDGAIELVLATRRGPGVSRVVEPGPRGIVERDFDELPESAWRVVERRLDLIVAVTVSGPRTSLPRSTASPTSRCSRRAGSVAATPPATR